MDELPRLRGRGQQKIEDRHVIDWLVRKPRAFEEDRDRDAMFPTSRFRMAYDARKEDRPARAAKEDLEILLLAAQEGETAVDETLRRWLGGDRPLCGDTVAEAVRQGRRPPAVTDVTVINVDLTMCDRLLQPGEGHEHGTDGQEGPADRAAQGTAPAGAAGGLRGAGAPGPAGVAERRAGPAEPDGEGVPGATRRDNRVERLLRESRLSLEKSLQTLDLKRLPPKLVPQVRALRDGTFADRCENVLTFGNPGSGKTHVLSSIGQEVIRSGAGSISATGG